MSARQFVFACLLAFAGALLLRPAPAVDAKEILVADRLTNSVFRYSEGGAFLGTLLTDNVNLNQPAGLGVSPDYSKLYVASSQNNQVVQYDYDFAAGTATNPTVFADAGDGLAFPNSIIFSPAGDKVYISNLGGTGVAQFNPDGTSAGAPINGTIGGGTVFAFSGLAFAPGGELLVGGFQNLAGTDGAIARSDAGITTISDFVGPSAALNGQGGLLVIGNDLYATGGFSTAVTKYDATTGAADGGFGPVAGLAFPANLIAAPDGNGILVGTLGFADGTGSIARIGFDGTPLGTFASAQMDAINGFTEPTALLVVVPEPSTCLLLSVGLAALSLAAWRRRTVRQ